jgi:hypothetical protein
VLQVPFVLLHHATGSEQFNVKVTAPDGWKVLSGAGLLKLPNEDSTALRVELQTKESPAGKQGRQLVQVQVEQDGKSIGAIRLMVELNASALAQ